jgi:metal-responsive CopG/Arc/MetJ family transcriptional regulator
MTKISIDSNLYERAQQAAAKAGFSSADELIATAIENELKRLGVAEAEQQVADQLRGLGYIE